MSNLLKYSIIATFLNALGLVLNFGFNIIVAAIFGAGTEMDAYLVSNGLPFFIIGVISSTISIIFIPIIADYKENNKDNLWTLISNFINIFSLLVLGLVVILMIFGRQIIGLLAPGFNAGDISRAATLFEIQAPIIFFCFIAEFLSSIFYSFQNYKIPLFAKLINPIISTIVVLALHEVFGITSLAIAILIAFMGNAGYMIFFFLRSQNFHYYFFVDVKHPSLGIVSKLAAPLIIGFFIYKNIPLFDRYIGSTLNPGSISHLSYAFRLFTQISGIITTGISITVFPAMSKMFVEEKLDEMIRLISKTIRSLIFIAVPISIFLALNSNLIIKIIFERGEFLARDTYSTSIAFSIYVVALPMAVIGTIIGQVYYVFKDTTTPVVVGIVEIIIYFLCVFFFINTYGYLAIPISYAIYFNFSLVNAFVIKRKMGISVFGKHQIKSITRSIGVTFLVWIVMYFPIVLVENVYLKIILVGVSLLLYFLINLKVLIAEEAVFMMDTIFSPMIRKLFNDKNDISNNL